jgi:hypothetical protein
MPELRTRYAVLPKGTLADSPRPRVNPRIRLPHILHVIPQQTNVTLTSNVRNAADTTTPSKQGEPMIEPPKYEESPFLKFFGRINNLSKLKDDWNSYGSAAPNKTALFWAHRVLQELLRANFAPRAIKPSSDEGVGIVFISPDKHVTIECLNSGHIFVIDSNSSGQPRIQGITPDLDHIKTAVTTLKNSFSI